VQITVKRLEGGIHRVRGINIRGENLKKNGRGIMARARSSSLLENV